MLTGLLVYLLVSAYIFIVYYYFLTGKYGEPYSFADRLLGTFILAISQIILTEMTLGFALKLNTPNLLIINLLISSCIPVVSGVRREEIASQFREVKYNISNFLRLVIRNKILLSVFILAFLQLAWWAFLVYLFPPYAWDDLWYHLPKMAYILQSNGIKEFQTDFMVINQFPFNGELLFLWNVIFPRNDILVNGSQVIFALFAVLSVYSLARKAGVKQQNAAWAVIFLFIPIVIQQATTCYIDIIMSALLIGAVNFMLLRDKPKINIFIFGLIIGIMLGAKYVFVAPCLIVSLAFWILTLANIRRNSGGDKIRRSRCSIACEIAVKLTLYLLPVLVLGGTWYIRNYVLFGNPVAPYQVELFGIVKFPGSINPSTEVLPEMVSPFWFPPEYVLNVWLERSAPIWAGPYYSYDGSRGFGPVFWILLIPSGIFAIIVTCRRRYWDYLVTYIVFVLCFLTIPLDWLSRYTIFVCGFGILSFTVLLEYLKRAKAISLMALPIIALTLIVGNFQVYLTPRAIADFAQKPYEQRQSSDFAWSKALGQLDFRELYRKVNEQRGTTILFSFPPNGFTYPLWNSDFSNRVLAIPGKYENSTSLMDTIRIYGTCYIITTEDSDIVKYYKMGEAKIDIWHVNSYAWVFYYPGEAGDKKKN